jgi:nucleotide-binding universal stress UspA family protein
MSEVGGSLKVRLMSRGSTRASARWPVSASACVAGNCGVPSPGSKPKRLGDELLLEQEVVGHLGRLRPDLVQQNQFRGSVVAVVTHHGAHDRPVLLLHVGAVVAVGPGPGEGDLASLSPKRWLRNPLPLSESTRRSGNGMIEAMSSCGWDPYTSSNRNCAGTTVGRLLHLSAQLPLEDSVRGKTIVVAIDGSPASDAAIETGLDLANALGSTVHFIHAASPLAEDVEKQRGDQFGGPTDAEIVAHDHVLAAAAERASQSGVECKVELIPETRHMRVQSRNDDLAADIAGIAEGREAGLIVIGSRGRGVTTSAVLGSVSHNLIGFATMPVVVVNASTGE